MTDRRRKLTEQQVAEIRAARAKGEKMPALAKRYSVTVPAIWFVLKGYTHKKA